MLQENELKNDDVFLEKEEILNLLSEVYQNPYLTQREISSRIKISLGKTNFLLNCLIDKGILKIKSFSRNEGKLKKVRYIFTPKGIQEKMRITYLFLKKKEREYNFIKEHWEKLKAQIDKIEKDQSELKT
ncbi:MAG: MarR family EPS-associated transcriptional regulator [Candidatus Omnitrophica bacterium]|nr:MarR family EPS-associated transcriptional regulator [Candidatus Omnitrophota bacterium]